MARKDTLAASRRRRRRVTVALARACGGIAWWLEDWPLWDACSVVMGEVRRRAPRGRRREEEGACEQETLEREEREGARVSGRAQRVRMRVRAEGASE